MKKVIFAGVFFVAIAAMAQMAILLPGSGSISLSAAVFNPARNAATVKQDDGTFLRVTNAADFGVLTNSLWPDIDQNKWSNGKFYRITVP